MRAWGCSETWVRASCIAGALLLLYSSSSALRYSNHIVDLQPINVPGPDTSGKDIVEEETDNHNIGGGTGRYHGPVVENVAGQDSTTISFLDGKSGDCFAGWKNSSTREFIESAVSDARSRACAEQFALEVQRTQKKLQETHPTVAVCMVGNARTLPVRSVFRRIQENFLSKLSRRSVLFMHLKAWDTDKKEQHKHGGFRSVPATVSNLTDALRALRPVWVYLETRKKAINSHKNPECELTEAAAKDRGEDSFYVGKYEDRYLAQMSAMSDCVDAVYNFERQAGGLKFDMIAKIRPDVTWFYPVRSAMDYKFQGDVYNIVTHLADQFILSPRRFSLGFQQWWKNYTNCKGEFKWAYLPEAAYRDAFKELGADYYEDKKTPQVIRRAQIDEPSATIACGRQRRVTNLTRCMAMVYKFDGYF